MNRPAALIAGIWAGVLVTGGVWATTSGAPSTAPRSDYILGCGGCHGLEGVSNSKKVPKLQGLVGYYLKTPQGRDYLPRLPNIAFSVLDDEKLAAVLNYMVFDLGGESAPKDAKPYVAAEVGKLRKHPLTEIQLTAYRREVVSDLIDRHQASADLRVYGEDGY